MYTCYCLFKRPIQRLILVFISIFMTPCQGQASLISAVDKKYCPFIETVSFGSDIDIRCNSSHFTFNEINSDRLNWKFANETSTCLQNGSQHARTRQCGVRRMGADYLLAPMKSLEHNEKACAYCRINYKPIAPVISTIQSEGGQHILYKFNLTATGLAPDESFEILWAKRVSDRLRYSYNYWFLHGCVDSIVKILQNTSQTIVFTVDDVVISRVEFIIRRCNGTCRSYDKCLEQQFLKEISVNYFQTPDSIEKVSCDTDCLYGRGTTTISAQTHVPSTLPSTTSLSSSLHRKMKTIILSIIFGLILLLALILLILCSCCKLKDKEHVYGKANHVDPDEHK